MADAEEEVIEIDLAELKKLKVPELKRRLAELGMETKGTKAELLARVERYLNEQEEDLLEEELEDEVEEETEGVEGEEEEVEVGDEEEEEEVGKEEEEKEKEKEKGENESSSATPSTKPESNVAMEQTSAITQPQASQPGAQAERGDITAPKPAGKKQLTQAERLQLRAQKYGGNTSEEAKKQARAQRFGESAGNGYGGLGKRPLSAMSEEEVQKLKKRSKRFGTAVAPVLVQVDQAEKKKHRQERFGMKVTELPAQDRKQRRADRFGTS